MHVCVRSVRSCERTRWFSQMTPDEHPRRHHLADGPLSSLYTPSPSLSSFGATSVMMCCSARHASSSAPSVLPEDRIDRNIRYIRRCCDHINVLHIFNQYRFEVRREVYDGPAWYLVLLSCPRLTPRRHRQADGQLSPRCPSLPSLSSFDAACVSSSLAGHDHVAAVSSSLQRWKYKFGLR